MTQEQLRQDEFDAHMRAGTLRIAFVGMSNAGKSYRSKVLRRDAGFFWYHVDGEIQRELGFADMSEISDWLGFPDSPTYPEREAKYLELENKLTKVDWLDTGGKNLVFDTTGSVIYLEESTLRWLRDYSLIINLDVDESAIPAMMEKFFKNLKPLMWNGMFEMQAGESLNEALERLYPALLKSRMESYRKLAHINIPASEVRDKTADETIEIIRSKLK